MALAFSEVVEIGGVSNRKVIVGKYTFDSSYLTGGETFVAADITGGAMTRIDGFSPSNAVLATGANQVAVAAINAGSGSWKLASAGDRAAAALLQLSETATTQDLSLYTGYFMAWGV